MSVMSHIDAFEPLTFHGMAEAYPILARLPLVHGDECSPRGQRTHELLGVSFRLEDPRDSLPYGTGRNLNTTIAAVEAVQLVGAFAKPDLVFGASSNFRRYAEPNGTFWGAYGHRIGRQVDDVVEKLSEDRDSRQAVITLWDPRLDNTPEKKDYPCTVSFTFFIRNDKLYMHTVMRSNDVWLGLAYDVFQFTQLQLTLARVFEIEVGTYTHTVQSFHAYERDWGHISMLESGTARTDVVGFGLDDEYRGSPIFRWRSARTRAELIGAQHHVGLLTESESWYVERIDRAYAEDDLHEDTVDG